MRYYNLKITSDGKLIRDTDCCIEFAFSGESGATQILLDVSEWEEPASGSVYSMVLKTSADTYITVFSAQSTDEGIVTAELPGDATALAGPVWLQVQAENGTDKLKSGILEEYVTEGFTFTAKSTEEPV